MRARAAAVVALAAIVLAGCGSGDDSRDRVEAYINDANQLQRGWRDEVRRANRAYRDFSAQKLAADRAVSALARAERDVRASRRRLAALQAPSEARTLRAKLLEVYDMNTALAHETSLLATYQGDAEAALKPIAGLDRRLRARLRGAGSGADQAAALARFGNGLDRALERLRAVEAPSVLRPAHESRLRSLEASRRLSEQLRRALEAKDERRVAQTLLRFRRNSGARESRRALAAAGLVEYDRRYRALRDKYVELRREQTRLERELG